MPRRHGRWAFDSIATLRPNSGTPGCEGHPLQEDCLPSMSESTHVPAASPRAPQPATGTSLLAGATAKARAIADSDMAAAISGFDWAATALGPTEGWPQSL